MVRKLPTEQARAMQLEQAQNVVRKLNRRISNQPPDSSFRYFLAQCKADIEGLTWTVRIPIRESA